MTACQSLGLAKGKIRRCKDQQQGELISGGHQQGVEISEGRDQKAERSTGGEISKEGGLAK